MNCYQLIVTFVVKAHLIILGFAELHFEKTSDYLLYLLFHNSLSNVAYVMLRVGIVS